ncbi:hypothetical protein BCV69DRAFT_309692 [Microstroma glucosiphilum]|uniref:Uncharacterized protein n=1 Tax=Pseudomicrostroma glucosiphilum TaxID=1684307 RepID=A0A316UEU5_9BASI|nr:hypothetical protein BCV69DRAFT_309692 [Pseudomicrostroma glucosiphilum]PWN23827.1 hypothetical protein BCV69DRAFT_309692 [Pseudomicrostroma glucosiphilum]
MQSSARPTPAAIIPLADLLPGHVGCKIRTAGVTLAYDTASQLGLISHRKTTLLVDFGLIAPTTFELKTKVMVMGDLEPSQDALPTSLKFPLPKIPATWQVAPMPGLVLRATILRPCHSLDLDVWEEAARRESAARWSEVQDVRGQRWADR